MKFLTFSVQEQSRLGMLLDENRVLDLTALLAARPDLGLPGALRNVGELIALGEEALARLREPGLLDGVDVGALPTLQAVRVLPPLPMARNVFCVGRNYREHIIEGNLARGRPANSFPEAIEFFTKAPTAVIGHGGHVKRHAGLTDSLDYEVELAIVIGRAGADIPREKALDHVFGYTIVNDITARDLQARHGQWFKGKSLDTSCPMGPVVVHRSAIPDANNLAVSLSVNGELRQQDNTSDMIFDVAAVVAQLSAGMTLLPGDVIATGTPKGVGFALTPPRCLQVGDVVSASVEHIGTLTNEIVA
ncbi:fumarylacetoacetate hydrolase family protein [Bordetella bronchiseptica]|uniref:Hydrolase n=1 Tax=Bordetella bronchiseptica (strain ATCC BAA-588 / NCTC 13252 / RB50) TaxID=257310 RepID=A0A0H3LPR7_BORBR|nr:fumarylacetoacetate hydrolase family protein [Bordetella bronchiseptica]KAK68785.1 FAH family protein [Bordetella bronchiseptica 980-2]AMG87929.1 FAA hydrolase family protein [Bordetella bronchiseptica]KCV52638.1 FAH family protein [Bordetella bronchiseptica 3E44]KCV60890.1 FAH family protein [Bordetella bronchiseptica 980]KDB86990.1 FAH family protein [Bordetella bronchiseptica D989]